MNFKITFWKSIKLTCLVFVLASLQNLYAQPISIPLPSEKSSTEIKSSDFQKMVVTFSFQEIKGLNIETSMGNFTELFLEKGHSIGEIGTPKLPASMHLIEIPLGAEVDVEVKSYTATKLPLKDYGITNPIFPMQPSLRKDVDPSQVEFKYNADSFAKDSYTENPLASIEVLGVMRGARIARLTIAPLKYNPAEGVIEFYNDLEVEVTYRDADIAKTKQIKASTFSPFFEPVYGKLFNRLSTKDVFDDHPDLTKNPIKMVIVSNRMFEETLQPFIDWKTQQGFFVTVGYTDVIGTTATAIQSYIHGLYNSATPDNPAPTFIIMVGDTGTMPASTTASTGVTDLYYASVDGDYFPEMYYGRLSARNVQELQNQIDKIVYYQKYEFEDPSYLNDVTLIAGTDGTWNPQVGQPTVKYGTANYFNAANGFDTVWGYGVTNDPNNPNNSSGYAGCYDNQRISVSLINFTAHCGPTSWAGPTLSVSDVHNMTNAGKYPLAIGNCCQSAQFSHAESIGEAWVRAQNKGAVAYIGSVPNTYWFEDFYWAVGAFPISGTNNGYVPTVAETTLGVYDAPFVSDYLSVAALKFVGNLAVTEVNIQGYPSHSSPLYYWQAYHTFGDPSTYVFLKEGFENEVSHMPIVPIGLNTYTVQALPGSYVGISKDGVLHGAALVDATGEAEVPINPILDGGDVLIVVTKPQYIPYIVEVPAAALEGPFVVLDTFEINDEAGNDNGLVDYGETFTIHVTLKNVGADNAIGISATISGADEYFSSNAANPVSFGNIPAGETGNTATVENAFSFSLANNVPDQHQSTFVIEITDGTGEWVSNLRIRAFAPVLHVGSLVIDDLTEGNGDGVLDPGETANLIVTINNTGSSFIENVAASLDILGSGSNHLVINSSSLSDNSISVGGSIQAIFNVTANEATPLGTPVSLSVEVTGGADDQYAAEGQREVIIGFIPEYCVSGATSTADSMCDGVEFGDLVNVTSGPCANYRDFTEDPDLVKEFVIGATYDIAVSLGTCGGNYSKGAKVYIDWNYDGDFTDEGEMVFYVPSQSANWTATGTVTIPATAPAGQKFMRVVVREGSDASGIAPCGTFTWGETQDYKIILVPPQEPVADFEAYPTETAENDIVSFTDKSLHHPASWSWDITPGTLVDDFVFVDGTDATSRHPKVQFATPAVYTVALTVTNLAGNNTHVKSDYVTINELTVVPVANFTASPLQLMGGQQVHFTDLSTNLPVAWNWTITPGDEGVDFDFANGSTHESKNPVVVFNTGGFYTVQLVATNPVGDSEPFVRVDYIEVVPTFLMQDGEVTVCSGMFFDSGGPDGDYQNNENYVFTFHPAMEGANMKVEFLTFNVEPQSTCNYDRLMVYDGSDTEATLLGTFCGTTVPGPFVATDGSLTFHFTTDGYVGRPGWSAVVSCHGPFYDVTFNVTSPGGPADGALVEVDGQEFHTGADGTVVASLQAGNHAYVVTMAGHCPYYGTIMVDQEHEVLVSLVPMHAVTFNIAAGRAPMQGATVTINGQSLQTNQQGVAVTELIDGTYDYTVSKPNFVPHTDQVVVSGVAQEVNVILQPFYTVTFQVATSGGPLGGASIEIYGTTLSTDNSGEAFIGLPPGNHAYTATYLDFPPETGTVSVTSENVYYSVFIETSLEEIALQGVRLFPNPFRGKVSLTGTSEVREVVVTNLHGQEIIRVKNEGADSMEVHTGNLPAGVYLFKLVGKDNQKVFQKMIKQ